MEIKHCLRCGEQWCYRGVGRPIRCGKCKSPYWDREKVVGRECVGEERRKASLAVVIPQSAEAPRSPSRANREFESPPDPTKELDVVEMCPYTEYDTDTGETYMCGRQPHGPKVKHTRGMKVEA